MSPPLTPAQFDALRALDSCALANAIEPFRVRLRNEGFCDGSIHCVYPRLRPMLGYAATLRIRGGSPPTGARTYTERTDWWDYVLSLPSPRVLVVEDISSRPGLGALLGDLHVQILRKLGCVGAVTNGSVREVPTIEPLGFPLFARSLSVSHSYVHIVDFGQSVTIGGLPIHSGDLLHGDLHGVQSVPLDLAPELPAVAAQTAAHEASVLKLCNDPKVSLDQLRAALRSTAT